MIKKKSSKKKKTKVMPPIKLYYVQMHSGEKLIVELNPDFGKKEPSIRSLPNYVEFINPMALVLIENEDHDSFALLDWLEDSFINLDAKIIIASQDISMLMPASDKIIRVYWNSRERIARDQKERESRMLANASMSANADQSDSSYSSNEEFKGNKDDSEETKKFLERWSIDPELKKN